ncbi:MAG: SH3 domain-containing protein [Erythrobacter sp.]
MNYKGKLIAAAACAAILTSFSSQALARDDDDEPQLARCDESMGTIALIDGDQAGWQEWKLGSPRALLYALALEWGFFEIYDPNDSVPARFLVTAIAGSKEEVDEGMELAKGAATEALLRSGAAGSILGGVPGGGAILGLFGGLGGKKRTVAAGLRVVSPANGLTVAAGQGVVKKSTIEFGNSAYGWASGAADAAGYRRSKRGRMLTEAYVLAFNQLVGQRELMAAAPEIAAAAPAEEEPDAVVAVDAVLRDAPASDAGVVRSLRQGTELALTGQREGLFIEVTDNYGTRGWVSVENLR